MLNSKHYLQGVKTSANKLLIKIKLDTVSSENKTASGGCNDINMITTSINKAVKLKANGSLLTRLSSLKDGD